MEISIILPTYNNEKTIKECLESIFMQDFPKNKFEVLFIDGGSTDKTLEIAKKFPVKIINNPHRIEERARVLGIKKSKGKFLCFIDADNVILEKDWFKKMIKPFEDKEIICSDTYYFSSRKNDSLITRYCSLIGGDDPFAIYLGIYDRYNYFKNNWTDLPYRKEEKKGYLKIKLNKKSVPAMGSNGFLFRKKSLLKVKYEPFIHTDIVYRLSNKGYFAKVDIGIVHIQRGIKNFFNKKIRRIKRRFSEEIKLEHNYGLSKKNLLFSCFYICLILPVIFDSFKGLIKKRDSAWFFHPVACFGELIIYGFYGVKYKLLEKWR